jgi:hypothetical protein
VACERAERPTCDNPAVGRFGDHTHNMRAPA